MLHPAHAVPAALVDPSMDLPPAPEGATRADLSAKIMDLEGYLRAAPQGPLSAAARAHVGHVIATTKRRIADMASPRVDSAVAKQLFEDLTLISAACAPPRQAAACAGAPLRLQPPSAASTACGSACSLGPRAAPATPAHSPILAPPPSQVRHSPSVLRLLQAAQAVDTPAEHPNGDSSDSSGGMLQE